MGRKPTRDITPKRLGAPTKLNDELLNAISALLANNVPLTTVADYVGINRDTIRLWGNRGAALIDELDENPSRELDEIEHLYVRFYVETNKSYAKGEISLVQNINNAAQGDWRAASWMLERTRPEKYGKIDRTEIQQNVTVDVDPQTLSRKLNELMSNVAAQEALESAIDVTVVDNDDDGDDQSA